MGICLLLLFVVGFDLLFAVKRCFVCVGLFTVLILLFKVVCFGFTLVLFVLRLNYVVFSFACFGFAYLGELCFAVLCYGDVVISGGYLVRCFSVDFVCF